MAKALKITKPISSKQATLARISLATGILYVFLLLVLHLIEPEFNPTWRFISEYSLGQFGLVMNLVLLSYSISIICLGLAIFSQVRTVLGYIGLLLLAISAVGILTAGLFNTDPITTEQANATFSGQMHILGATLDFSPFAMLLLAFSLGRNQVWNPIKKRLLIIASIPILLTILFIMSIPPDYKFGPNVYTGMIGRFLFISYFLWILVVVQRIKKLY